MPSYFTNGKVLAASGWEHKKIHDLLQVQSTLTDPTARSPRTMIRKYTLTEDTCVGVGGAVRNGQFGSGGGRQYFMPESEKGKVAQGGTVQMR